MILYSQPVSEELNYPVDTRIYVKRSWAETWTWVSWLQAEYVKETAAPILGECILALDFQNTEEVEIGNQELYQDSYLVGSYVKIEVSTSFGDETLWIGKLDSRLDPSLSDDSWDGSIVKYHGYSIEGILNQIIPDRSYTDSGIVNKLLPFNKDGVGNRSSVRSGDSYVYSSDGDDWSVYNIIEYLVVRFVEAIGISFEIIGDISIIQNLEIELDYNELSVLDILNALIHQKFGIGWHIGIGTNDTLSIDVFSMSYSSIQISEGIIPANELQFNISIPSGDENDIVYSTEVFPKYDIVDVIGGPITTCFTIARGTGLEAGWDFSDVSDYEQPSGTTNNSERDAYRSEHRSEFLDVYQKYQLDMDWNWANPGGHYIWVECDYETGELSVNSATPTIWSNGKSFNKLLPYKENTTDRMYMKPFMFIWRDGAFRYVDKLQRQLGIPSGYLHVAEDELAIYNETEPNHIQANGTFDDSYSDTSSIYDYNDFYATVSIETDELLRYRIESSYESDVPLVKTINLPNKEAHYIVESTTKKVANGSFVYSAGEFTRNDMNDVLSAANLAFVWYSYDRAAITFQYNSTVMSYPIGSIVMDLVTADKVTPIKTPVVERIWTFSNDSSIVPTTKIRTGFVNLEIS